jgi:ComF family protein
VSAYVFEKDGTLQTLLHALKYGGNSAIGKELGEALARRLAMMPWSSRITAVVPVPLHPVKKRERGFNQAEIVAEAVAGGLGVPLRIDLLDRIRHTATQTHLGTKERQQNMAGAFRVRVRAGCAPREEHILLVDDVVTTGATIVEAAGALLASGAAECFAGTVAIAAL